jgi:catechol 2,3-dioxygenase-like lactoylglutathione lyase family enzyme
MARGWSHIGLSTNDLDATRAFYEGVLGFPAVRCDILPVAEGGEIRHIFFDTGNGQLVAFMEARQVPGIPSRHDTGIAGALGVPPPFYHFSFDAGSLEELEAKRAELEAKGVEVTPIVDHDWSRSVYFMDPNGLMLEYCAIVRALGEDDARMQVRETVSLAELGVVVESIAERVERAA